jgi:hypothetical protein
MTGFVLALAGLTCGDGGPGVAAAQSPLSVSPFAFSREWEGQTSADDGRWRMRLSKGVVSLEHPDVGSGAPEEIAFRPDGAVLCGGKYGGRYTLEGGRLVVRFKGVRAVLHPAVPRKP